jgi:putative ABC transport system permease protein
MRTAVPFLPPGLRNVALRYLLVRRWQSLFMVLGIALGVAVMVAIDLANASAERAFELSSEAVTGSATHQILSGPGGVDQQVYATLRTEYPGIPAAPVVTDTVSSPELGNLPLQLLGIDPLADNPFRAYLDTGQRLDLADLLAFFTQPGAVLLSAENASRYGLQPGDRFSLELGGRSQPVFLAGVLEPQDGLNRRTLNGLILSDVATAQELTGRIGRLDRIDLILPDPSATTEGLVNGLLPPGAQLVNVADRSGTVAEMTEAFRLNLSALSMLALVVGLFLIYNTMTFSVVQRRPLFGTLRCLGVTRREIFTVVLAEAFSVGILGSLLGVGLGVLLGRNTVGAVTQTVNDLYFTTTVEAVGIPAASLIKGALAGLLATIVTALSPAIEAASVPPRVALYRSGLESKARSVVFLAAGGGVLVMLFGLLMFSVPSERLIFGFTGTFAVLVGFAMLSALLLLVLMRLITPLTAALFGLLGRLAPRSLGNALSRTSIAVAALMVAVGVTIGVNLMIDSFRYTVTVWLDQTLQGDIYISVPSFNANRSLAEIDPAVVTAVQAWPGLEQVDTLRSVVVESRQGPVQLSASTNIEVGSERLYRDSSVPPGELDRLISEGQVLVSEPLANRLNLSVGSPLELSTAQGWQTFPVAGIFYDYSSSEGSVLMYQPVYRQLWKEPGTTAIGIRLSEGTDADSVARQLEDALVTEQQLLVRPNRELRADVMEVFDRTFAVTAALRILATVVAFIGILSALLLLQLEKQREIGILRALGLTGRQLWKLVMLETGLMGLSAGLLAMPAGYGLALILVYIINLRSFGWTLQMAVSPGAFGQALLISLAAALLAGIYPAYKMSRMAASEAVRYE